MIRLLALALGLVATSPALAHKPGEPPHQSYVMGDLRLESGEVIKDFAISYVTHGTLNASKSNVILVVTNTEVATLLDTVTQGGARLR